MALLAFKCSEPPSYPKPLGDILDGPSLLLSREQCRANGLMGSLIMDSQQGASDWLKDLYMAMNAAPVWSGFTLKSIPYSEVSAVGNGAIYIAPTASGPVANLTEDDLIGDAGSPLVSVERKAQVDIPNLLQLQTPNRASEYNTVVTSQPESASIALFGQRKADPQTLNCVQDVAVARMILSIMVRRQNYVRNTYKFKLKAKWKLLEPMDLVTINDSLIGVANLPVRLTSVAEDDQYNLDCEAEPFFYGVNAPTAPTINVTGAIYATGGNGALSIPGSLDILALSNPSAPTITTHGTAGSTSYSYVVIALQADGSTTAASSAGSTATGNATLSSSNYNIVTWTAVPMAVSYSVYRTSGGATQGKIASGLTSLSVNDTGLTGDGTTAPSTNTTGSLTANGNVNLNGTTTLGAGLNLNGQTISGSAALSGQTLSGNATLSGTITCSGSLAISTPANISFGSGWQTWTPTISAAGGMTTSGASGSALYIRIGPWIFFQINYSTTLGGTASNAVIFSVPISSSSQGGTVSPAAGVISIVGQTFAPAMLYVNSSNQIVCYVNSGANYPSGAATFYISGFYRCA